MGVWYKKYLQVYERPFAEAPQAVVEEVRQKIAGLQSENPVVTVSLIGYNEEKHLLACLWSLSEMQCKYPVEIIGVDNESKDRTAEIDVYKRQVQQQHHINAERFRRIQFRHHTGDIIVIQQIYFQIKILILLHYSFYFNKLFTKILLFGRANSVSAKVF